MSLEVINKVTLVNVFKKQQKTKKRKQKKTTDKHTKNVYSSLLELIASQYESCYILNTSVIHCMHVFVSINELLFSLGNNC